MTDRHAVESVTGMARNTHAVAFGSRLVKVTQLWTGWGFSLYELYALVNGGEFGVLGCRRDAGANRIQVDVRHGSENGGFVEQGLALKAAFPEAASAAVFGIRPSRQMFVHLLHEPTDAH
jgi:hypothetical protein